jgi:hypothetical protein
MCQPWRAVYHHPHRWRLSSTWTYASDVVWFSAFCILGWCFPVSALWGRLWVLTCRLHCPCMFVRLVESIHWMWGCTACAGGWTSGYMCRFRWDRGATGELSAASGVVIEVTVWHPPQDHQIPLTVLSWASWMTYISWSKFFYPPTDAQVSWLKNNFKIYIKIDIKTAPTCFGAITII